MIFWGLKIHLGESLNGIHVLILYKLLSILITKKKKKLRLRNFRIIIFEYDSTFKFYKTADWSMCNFQIASWYVNLLVQNFLDICINIFHRK
jgi:hypothetical protein